MEDFSDDDLDDVFKPKKSRKVSTHEEINSENVPLICKSCKAEFTVREDLFHHEHTCEKQASPHYQHFSCKLCKAKFTLKKNLVRHERKCEHPNRKSNPADISLSCSLCKAKFTLRKNLLRHARTCNGENLRRYKCCDCEKRFFSKHLLDIHFKKFHSEGNLYNCKFCNTSFKHKKYYTQHMNSCSANAELSPTKFQCSHCEAQFKRKADLKHHLKRCSSENPSKPMNKIPCLIQDCCSTFTHKIHLIHHLTASHKDQIIVKPKKSLNFTSFEEFIVWKEKEEEKTFSYFTSRKGQASKAIRHFYCQHDGSSKTHMKSGKKTTRCNRKGRIKVDHYCIAKMKVTIDNSNAVQVDYYSTHSHICKKSDVLHHPLPSKMSKYINEKITENIPADVVYELIKDRFIQTDDDQVLNTRASILSRKRVLERGRGRQKACPLHKDDAKSVYLMVEKLIQKGNSVLIYKPFGTGVAIGSEDINKLPNSESLFLFGFQTDKQLELMKKYCAKIVVVDETHETNQYNYKLLTIMVIDNDCHDWPVAHLITNRSDDDTLHFFFQALRSRLDQNQQINCVITDDDFTLINSMTAGFNQSFVHLLCKRDVLKNLKENLRSKVSSDLYETMFNEMKSILNAKTEPLFLQLKTCFIQKYKYNPGAVKYLIYLQEHYWDRAEKWATCYRNFSHEEVDTTGHLESFRDRLKKVYLKRKVNKRLDILINILYTIAWDDHCSRLRNTKIGAVFQPREMVERHKRGMKINDDVIVGKSPDGRWTVKSERTTEPYFIDQYKDSCDCDCYLKCTQQECHGLCSHLFSCSCPDFHPLCEHIHKLRSFLFKGVPYVSPKEDFYDFNLPYANEEVCDIDQENVSDTTQDKKKQITLEKLQRHLSIIQQFLKKDIREIPDHCIYQGEALLSDYVQSLQAAERLSSVDLNFVPEMKPAEVFTPNQKLKILFSQLLPFKQPPKKGRKEDAAICTVKNQAVIDGLLEEIVSSDLPACVSGEYVESETYKFDKLVLQSS